MKSIRFFDMACSLPHKYFPLLSFGRVVFFLLLFLTFHARAVEYREVIIQQGSAVGKVEQNIVCLLAERLKETGLNSIKVLSSVPSHSIASDQLLILFGKSTGFREAMLYLESNHLPPLTTMDPGPEGFLLYRTPGQNLVLATGIDDRGCLYAAGELLRQVVVRNGILTLPEQLNIRSAPAFEIRGTQVQQSDVSLKLAKTRSWTDKEMHRVILDYALAGANIFQTDGGSKYDFLKSFGLMTQGEFGANSAGKAIPAEWEAKESIGRSGYVCLSVPEARQFMIDSCENYFKSAPAFDLVKFYGGDGGGCECDRCKPYGLTFIRTVEEMAAAIHKYHPETRIYFTNQKFDNEDDNAIFSYLQEKPRNWLWAWGYGPGSDATTWQPGHRQTHRMDLFRYPGYGPYGLYPKEILHQLPPQQKLLYYNEITHWKYAQHAFIQMYPRPDRDGNHPPHWSHEIYERRPDQFLTMVYNRLSFYACPKNYFRIFNDLLPFGIGDITHSSGHHDHFNQWMWQRLLWAPRTDLSQVVDEYCRTWFGPEAAPLMAKALYLLEENIEEQPGHPLNKKTGILSYYELVKKAGSLMPPEVLRNDWLWRMYMQKGVLDRYTQLNVGRQTELQSKIEKEMAEALKTNDPDPFIRSALTWFDLRESAEMLALKKEAVTLGEESNRIFGERNDGLYNLEHDFIGLGWLHRQLERALKANGNEKRELLERIADYENPGIGGFYDNLGTYNRAPDLVAGYPYDHGQPYVSQMLSENNRPSQRSMHYTQNEEQGVTLHYSHLDKKAAYKIQFTFVRPWYQERYAGRMNQKSQSIFADDQLLAGEVELPLQMSDFFTYDIPQKATADGELTITLKKSKDVAQGDRVSTEQWRNSGGWGTIASEAWLIKK